VSIPEEMIMQHLDLLLTSSQPGDEHHHLHLVAAPADAVGPLGLVDESKLVVSVYVMVPPPDAGDAQDFLYRAIKEAGRTQDVAGAEVLFAAMSQESWSVLSPTRDDHPDAAELTTVYAACRDGRRWRSARWLTGPRAGTGPPPQLLTGRASPHEARHVLGAHLVRELVGLVPTRGTR
jgi:hypothetical protein